MQNLSGMLLLAAQTTAWEKFRRIPMQAWINLAICVLAVVIVVRLWRTLKKFNDYAPYFAAMLAGSMIFFYWVYNRAEPKFLTPVVDQLVNFLPTKSRQEQALEKLRKSRD